MKPASTRSADAGFTLIEVVVAITIIGGALLTVLAATTAGFEYQNMARQRQTATALANQVMERVRGSDYNSITQGVRIDAGDRHAIACGRRGREVYRLISCGELAGLAGSGERIAINALAAEAPFGPNHNSSPVQIDGQEYEWWFYVSRASNDDADPWRLTVFVDWAWRGDIKSISIQSIAWAPEGRCLGSGVNPVSLPCAAGEALSVTAAGVTLSASMTGASVGTSVGSAAARYVDEQATLVTASADVRDNPADGVTSASVGTAGGYPLQTDVLETASRTQTLQESAVTSFTSAAGTSQWKLRLRYQYSGVTPPPPMAYARSIAGVSGGDPEVAGNCQSPSFLYWPTEVAITSGSPCGVAQVRGSRKLIMQLACTSGCAAVLGDTVDWIPLAVIDLTGWQVTALVDATPAVTLTGSASYPRIYLGGLGRNSTDDESSTGTSLTGFAWMAELYEVRLRASLAVGERGALSVLSNTFSLSTLTPSVPTACTQYGVATPLSTVVWSSLSRCLSKDEGPLVAGARQYRFSLMTTTSVAPGNRVLTGPVFGFSFQVWKCPSRCDPAARDAARHPYAASPLVAVQLDFGQISFAGRETEW